MPYFNLIIKFRDPSHPIPNTRFAKSIAFEKTGGDLVIGFFDEAWKARPARDRSGSARSVEVTLHAGVQKRKADILTCITDLHASLEPLRAGLRRGVAYAGLGDPSRAVCPAAELSPRASFRRSCDQPLFFSLHWKSSKDAFGC